MTKSSLQSFVARGGRSTIDRQNSTDSFTRRRDRFPSSTRRWSSFRKEAQTPHLVAPCLPLRRSLPYQNRRSPVPQRWLPAEALLLLLRVPRFALLGSELPQRLPFLRPHRRLRGLPNQRLAAEEEAVLEVRGETVPAVGIPGTRVTPATTTTTGTTLWSRSIPSPFPSTRSVRRPRLTWNPFSSGTLGARSPSFLLLRDPIHRPKSRRRSRQILLPVEPKSSLPRRKRRPATTTSQKPPTTLF